MARAGKSYTEKMLAIKKLDFPRKGLYLYLQGVHQDVQVEEASLSLEGGPGANQLHEGEHQV